MAKPKQIANEREYIIPLRREILKVPRHKRTPKAIKAIKQFIAKHMRIPDRDVKKVKIHKYLNQELWFRGIKNPITKVKVKVKRDGENILVELVDLPEKVKFKIANEEKKKALKAPKKKGKTEVKKEEPVEKTAEEKKEEKEKADSVAETTKKLAKETSKTEKHTATKGTKQAKVQPIRKALKK